MRGWILVVAVTLVACDRPDMPAQHTRTAAASPGARAAPATPVTTICGPLLWTVRARAGTSDLYGTMHVGVGASRDVSREVLARVDAARVLITETDLSRVTYDALLASARRADGRRLDQELTPAQWRVLTGALTGYPPSTLRQLRPWFVLAALTQTLATTGAPMDAALLARARDAGVSVTFLETLPQQLAALDAAVTAAELAAVIDDLDRARHELADLAAAYRRGDAGAIAGLLFDPARSTNSPRLIDALFTRRNEQWMNTIVASVDEGGAFIAVGVGHVVGSHGLVARLRARGYRVDRAGVPCGRPSRRAR